MSHSALDVISLGPRLEVLTNFVAVFLAGVGVELQGRLGGAPALAGNLRLHLLGVGDADGLQVVRVRGVAGHC